MIGLLIILGLGGISLMAAVDIWQMQRQREREEQLIFVGEQYRQAIRKYYYSSPIGSPHTLPSSLEALLDDERYPIRVRHLRRLYPDPITGNSQWGEIKAGDRIAGVYSLSESQPIKQAGFSPANENFVDSSSYQDWVFTFNGALQTAPSLPSGINTLINTPRASPERPAIGNIK
jgi:type II secretory pathway pseudopilin PulG